VRILVAHASGSSIVGKEPSLAGTAVIIGTISELAVLAGLRLARGDVTLDRFGTARGLALAIAAFQLRFLAAVLQVKVKVVGRVVAIVPALAGAHVETFSRRTVFAQLAVVVAVADARVGFLHAFSRDAFVSIFAFVVDATDRCGFLHAFSRDAFVSIFAFVVDATDRAGFVCPFADAVAKDALVRLRKVLAVGAAGLSLRAAAVARHAIMILAVLARIAIVIAPTFCLGTFALFAHAIGQGVTVFIGVARLTLGVRP
jgi:hypothetical protein